MMNFFFRNLVLLATSAVLGASMPAFAFSKDAAEDPPALFSFSTGGYSVYHLKPATINNSGARVIISAAFDGTVLCHSRQGELIWKNETNKDFPFDLAVADINSDGFDESFIATGGGKVYAFNADGTNLWSYTAQAPLFQVCPVKLPGGEWKIFTGGIEETIIALSSAGDLLSSVAAGNVVRHIRKGNIMGDGNEYVAIATASSGLTGNLALILLNPSTMTQVWKKTGLGVAAPNSGRRFFSMIVEDIDKNGKDNIVVSNSWGDYGLLYGFDETGTQMITNSTSTAIPKAPYRMIMLSSVNYKNTDNDFIFGIFANMLIIYNANGSFNSTLECNYDFSNAAFDPETNTYYLGSSPSGGDGIYALNLDNDGWQTAFQQIAPVGRLAEVESNLNLLAQQVNGYTLLPYQKSPPDIFVCTPTPPSGTPPDNINYVTFKLLTQVVISGELWCKSLDTRYAYDQTSQQIINYAKEQEAKHTPFYLWGGHGTAVYMSPSTLEEVINQAPGYFQGFIFAEMEQTDTDMQRVLNEIMLPLAVKCASAGKKILIRNKGVFWSGTCYLDFWSNVLFDPRFHNVFVPSLEETNNRTQEISLAARVGLWATGIYDNWSARPVTDNACFERMWEWSSQQVMSHYIRMMALRASLGSLYFQVEIHQARFSNPLYEKLKVFYDMVGKGVIAIPSRNEILSVSDVCLGMKQPPSEFYINRGINGHTYDFPGIAKTPMVFDRLDCFWGGAPMLDHDFSKYGYGAERRMLNFLPEYPYGLVAIVPDNTDINKFPWIREKISTNGMNFYDTEGTSKTPSAYKETVVQKLEAAAERLSVRVTGDVAWSVVRLDRSHVRVTLVDPGYTDPKSRNAVIKIQNLAALNAVDILSKQTLAITDSTIVTTVPAGSLRIIDIEHTPVTSVDNPVSGNKIQVYPNPSHGTFTIKGGDLHGDFTITIYDLCGRPVHSERVSSSGGELLRVIRLDQKGIFIVRITGEKYSFTDKIIIR